MSKQGGRRRTPGRPRGYEKTGGIVHGQTWARDTVADEIWGCTPRTDHLSAIRIAERAKANYYTVKATLRLWRLKGAVARTLDGYRRIARKRPSVGR